MNYINNGMNILGNWAAMPAGEILPDSTTQNTWPGVAPMPLERWPYPDETRALGGLASRFVSMEGGASDGGGGKQDDSHRGGGGDGGTPIEDLGTLEPPERKKKGK